MQPVGRTNNRLKIYLGAIAVCAVMVFSQIAYADSSIDVPKPLTVAWVDAQFKTHDAISVVAQLWEHNRYNELMKQISSGKSEWIELSPKLAPGTDAGSAEDLGVSLAYALPVNPTAVLGVLDAKITPISPKRVCAAPFIEDTVKDIPGYINQSKAALQKIDDPHLMEQKTICLAELEKASEQIKANSNQQ